MTGAAARRTDSPAWRSTLLVCVGLTSLIWLVFGQTLRHQFVAYDDQNYVYENPVVIAGFTANGVRAAFTEPHARNWHPLTTLSHMLDSELYGMRPAGHHFTSVLLHNCAALLLFLVLRQMTASTWRSAFVAAIFAIHPLRVESVAWVAERKDVLSALFFMLTLAMYTRYVARPTLWRYAAVLTLFAFGLMAKPMLVTLPLLLLLLDYWPLRRLQKSEAGNPSAPSAIKLLLEKIPLLLLSLAAGVATLIVQKSTLGYGEKAPFTWRLGKAATACVTYVWQMFWPAKLTVFYPQPAGGWPLRDILLCLAFLAAVTAIVLWFRKTRPYLVVGWSWYLIALSPTLGLIPVGLQAHADRYTYLPQIGLYVALTWFAADVAAWRPVTKWIFGIAAPAAVAVLTCLAWAQTSSWRTTETLWENALAVTPTNEVAHYNLALFALDRGQLDKAISHFQDAIAGTGDRETSSHVSAALLHNGLGIALDRKGLEQEALAHYRLAVELRDDFADAHTNLARDLLAMGATSEAVAHFRKAKELPPEDAKSHLRLAVALARFGQPAEATREYQRALELTPDPELFRNLKKDIEAELKEPKAGLR
ncbi:MAG: protein O-mannosyl-transferase [Verrucomicrobiota bacterium]